MGHSGEGKPLHGLIVRKIRLAYKLRTREDRLRARGLLTIREIAGHLGVAAATIKAWRLQGYIQAHTYDDKGQCLAELPTSEAPLKYKWKKRGPNAVRSKPSHHVPEGVQYEA